MASRFPDRAAARNTPETTGQSRPGDGAPTGEGGFIAVEWVAAIVFLLIPVVLIGAGLSRWPERQQVARASAAEGARVAVLSDSQADAFLRANQVADAVATNYGVPTSDVQVQVEAVEWDWGADVTVTVTIAIPALEVPGMGSWSPGTWSTSSTQRIEDYRGLE